MDERHLRGVIKKLFKEFTPLFPKYLKWYSDYGYGIQLDMIFAGYVSRIIQGKKLEKKMLDDLRRINEDDKELDRWSNEDSDDGRALKYYYQLYDKILFLCYKLHGYPVPSELQKWETDFMES